MKIDFLPLRDDTCGEYCLYCHAETVEWIVADGRKRCTCGSCGREAERAVVVDPRICWWTDSDGEYWHESAGVFVRDPGGRFLFFQRTAFPYRLTVPAGHVERGEDPKRAAARELWEEVGIRDAHGELRLVVDEHLNGDMCRRGSDAHRWHAYLLDVDDHRAAGAQGELTVNEEGEAPLWLTLDQALSSQPTFAVGHIIDRYSSRLLHAVGRTPGEGTVKRTDLSHFRW
ncbi:NUDIX hydrolase [Streptomyces lunaelactis]|uniref:NUDIX hydrolase n=1 Tax=Streptomyces lunaelactis TaxID=1535768 RepID=UPI0015853DFC|nr:NUDIX hydrolase [Streptomyces lunaelactis]NUK05991.1 NUDIX hydrolase [Streptomyces lunaelactis]NUK27919.1 NUDIX hydrolase [Streptomyces lunaelactis]